MSTTFRFTLPQIALDVTPVLRIDTSRVSDREILLFSFGPETDRFRNEPSFAWSASLDSLFRYATPGTDATIFRTRSFTVPPALVTLSITPHRWEGSPPTSIVDIALESLSEDVPLTILAERSPR